MLGVVAEDLAPDDWFLVNEVIIPAGDPLSGVRVRARGVADGRPRRGGSARSAQQPRAGDPLTITLLTYETEADAADELERARSTTYQDCEVEQRRVARGLGAARVEVLPEDPAAPGVAIAMTETEGEGRTEYDVFLVVGRMRAHDRRVLLRRARSARPAVGRGRQVAAALAEEQGLPVPG